MSRQANRGKHQTAFLEDEGLYEYDPDQTLHIDIATTLADLKQRGFQGSRIGPNYLRASSGASSSSSKSRMRASPKKFYEKDPFLAIDTTSKNYYFIKPSGQNTPVHVYENQNMDFESKLNSKLMAEINSSDKNLKSSSATSQNSKLRRTPSHGSVKAHSPGPKSGYRSEAPRSGKINHHVKMPFKHNVRRMSDQQIKVNSPSQGLKERTAIATHHVNRILAQEKYPPPRKSSGRLLQGNRRKRVLSSDGSGQSHDMFANRLMPLYPVHVEGPSIKHCRGIVADTRSYSACPSRTLQRQKLLIYNINNMNYRYHHSKTDIGESVHQTSEASTYDDHREKYGHEDITVDDLGDIERPFSNISLSPLPVDGGSELNSSLQSEELDKDKEATETSSVKERKVVKHQLPRNRERKAVKNIKPVTNGAKGMNEDFTVTSQELSDVVDSLKGNLFASFEDTAALSIETVARAQNVNNSANLEENPNNGKISVGEGGSGEGTDKETVMISEVKPAVVVEAKLDYGASSVVSDEPRGLIKSAGSLHGRPHTTGSSVMRGSSSKSVRFVDEQDKTSLSNNSKRDSSAKPSRSSCRPPPAPRKSNADDSDDDKENIPRKIINSGEDGASMSTVRRFDAINREFPNSQSGQGNVDELDQSVICSEKRETFSEDGSISEGNKENPDGLDMQASKEYLSEPTVDPMVQSKQSQIQFSVSPEEEVSQTSDKSNTAQEVDSLKTDTNLNILDKLQFKEMEPLVIELAETKPIEEGTNTYNVSPCSSVINVLEKYPDLYKYLKVEPVSQEDTENICTSPEIESPHPAFKITFSSYEPEILSPSNPAETKTSEEHRSELEFVSRSLKRQRRKKCKVSKSSSTTGIKHGYESSRRQAFPSDILSHRSESARSDDKNSPSFRRSSSPSCRMPNPCRRQRPMSASSYSKSHSTFISNTSVPQRPSFRKPRPRSAPSCRNSRLFSQSAEKQVRQTSPKHQKENHLKQKVVQEDDMSPLGLDQDESALLSFNELEKQIDIIQSELRKNIDEHTDLLSKTENLRDSLKTSRSQVDESETSSNSDQDSAVCEENKNSADSENANRDPESNEYYENLLQSYRKMCMDISENCVMIAESVPETETSVTADSNNAGHYEIENGENDGYKMALEVTDSGCESEAVYVEEEVDDAEEKCLLEQICKSLPEEKDNSPSETRSGKEKSPLEVVAVTKKLSKQKSKDKSVKTLASFPPLCFSVNARPPEGYLYYFSYGTDMNINRISNYLSRNVESRFWGLLFGFNLVFNKKGFDEDVGGFPNIEFNPFCSVEGCIYQLTAKDVEILDKCIGYPEHYAHLMVPVWMSNCKDPDSLGVAQHCVPALTYIAEDKWIQKDLQPCDFAVSQCLKSSDLLTTAYKEHLFKLAVPSPSVQTAV